jgi:hypothetical protein
MKKKHVLYCCLAVLFTGVAVGFLAGRQYSEKTETVTYVREQVITGRVAIPDPVRVEVPAIAWLPARTDTVYVDSVIYVRQVVDTAAIIADYELKRSYVVPLFDNSLGKLDVSLSTQYNRLWEVSYEFVPVTKTVYRERTWRPFVSAGYSTFGYMEAGGGMFYKKTGILINSQFNKNKTGVKAGLIYLF